jgi:hypothetical protein
VFNYEVTTRNLTQIRSHAQKYFKKLERDKQKDKAFHAMIAQDLPEENFDAHQPEPESEEAISKRHVSASDNNKPSKRQRRRRKSAPKEAAEHAADEDDIGVFSLGDMTSWGDTPLGQPGDSGDWGHFFCPGTMRWNGASVAPQQRATLEGEWADGGAAPPD